MKERLNHYWKKYLEGTISKKEIKILLHAFDENQSLIESWIQEKWNETSALTNKDSVANEHQKKLWGKIKKNISYKNAVNGSSLLKIASVVVILVSSVLIWQNSQPDYKTLIVNAGKPAEKFILPDGSLVWLNSASTLKYQSDFNKNRSLELIGEAFFEVIKNEKSPFKVKFSETELKVKGTQFNINAYPEDSISIVHIKQGNVEVYNKVDSASLQANDYLLVNNKKTFKKTEKEYDNSNSFFFKEDMKVFKNTSLLKIFKSVERRHNVIFNYDSVNNQELKNTLVTIKINHKIKLKEILEGLTLITKYNYEILTGNKIIIKQKT